MELTQEYLKSMLHYDTETGAFTWRVSIPRSHMKPGDAAGCRDGDRYPKIQIGGKAFLAHRIAFLYMLGEFPAEQVDHINGIKYDNRWANLRLATPQENQRNLKRQARNKSGRTGVRWQSNRWAAYIGVSRKLIHLGRYTDYSEAVAARKDAEIEYGFHQNHGRTA